MGVVVLLIKVCHLVWSYRAMLMSALIIRQTVMVPPFPFIKIPTTPVALLTCRHSRRSPTGYLRVSATVGLYTQLFPLTPLLLSTTCPGLLPQCLPLHLHLHLLQ